MQNAIPDLFSYYNNDPAEDSFNIEDSHISELAEFLTTVWNKKETITFWHLEDLFDAHKSKEWNREKLIAACRYLYANNFFDQSFWQVIFQHRVPGSLEKKR